MININEVEKSYKIEKEQLQILKKISLHIEKGEFVSILGPSGCGKSTLLNIIAGLDQYDAGEMLYNGTDTKKFSNADWDDFRKNHIGFIFQNFNLLPHLTALQNVEMAMSLSDIPKQEKRKRAKELLELVELGERMNHRPNQLSGGQKQRVAIARALANTPEILLADEPTGAVDSKTSLEIMQLLKKLNKEQGMTIVMVTHSDDMANHTDRKICMLDGVITKEIIINEKIPNSKELHNQSSKKSKRMPLFTAIEVAITNIRKKKGRNLLTILGTSIGIASVLIMLGLGVGAEERAFDALSSFIGDKTVWVETKNMDILDSTIKDTIKKIEGVEYVLDSTLFTTTLLYNNLKCPTTLDSYGPMNIINDYEKSIVKKGKRPTSDTAYEVVISEDAAKVLVGNEQDYSSIIGKKIKALITLENHSSITYQIEKEFTVCGISGPGILGISKGMIPYETANTLAAESLHKESLEPVRYEVRAKKNVDETQVASKLKAMGFSTSTNATDFKNIGTFFTIIRGFLMLIAGISLVVSGIMISIVLYTNVVERTKEIGTLRALGARKKDIKRIFLTEAGSLGLFAGVVGVIIALIIGIIINVVAGTVAGIENFKIFQLDGINIILGIAFSILVSVISGSSPAHKASKINVIDALRYE